MQITIDIPDNIPKETAMKHIRTLEKKLRQEAESFEDDSNAHNNEMRISPRKTMRRDEETLKQLVQDGRISEARAFLAFMPPDASPELKSWNNALAPPKLKRKMTATGGSMKKDADWLRKNAVMHQGKWVALKDGILLGSHESQVALHRSLKQSGGLEGAIFFKLESETS